MLSQFQDIILKRTGLFIREQDSRLLDDSLHDRMKALNIESFNQYFLLLSDTGTESKLEWKNLSRLLTTGESFFFRDKGQFTLLKNMILPELITRHEIDRTIKIWSAGCSTGEEPYSLAILLSELLPYIDSWNITIIGTDINEDAIAAAKSGYYNQWSFRSVRPEIIDTYFKQSKGRYKINTNIQKMVTFQSSNLIGDDFPDLTSGLCFIDLIICRNVFIYFGQDAIATVIKKFSNTLNDRGYLITGHAELHTQKLGSLVAKVLPESIIYQKNAEVVDDRTTSPVIPILIPSLRTQKPAPAIKKEKSFLKSLMPVKQTPASITIDNLLKNAATQIEQGSYLAAVDIIQKIIQKDSRNFDAIFLLAQAYANIGYLDKATIYCKKAIEIDILAIEPYYLLAHVAEELGDSEEVKTLLKKIIYLDSAFIPAYLELGALYEREDDTLRSLKMRQVSIELLSELPPNTIVVPYNEWTAGQLLAHTKKTIEATI
jgi:chemotaxis protein methyltransferase CheR